MYVTHFSIFASLADLMNFFCNEGKYSVETCGITVQEMKVGVAMLTYGQCTRSLLLVRVACVTCIGSWYVQLWAHL